MSSARLAAIQAAAAAAASTAVDMNEAVSGGGGRLIPAAAYVGRLCEYTDLGTQPQEYQGKAKDPAPEIRLGVALFYTDPENPADPAPYVLRPGSLTISRNEKAGAFKAFAALNYKRDPNKKHFAQFLGEAFIFHVGVKKAKASGREYNVIEWDKTGPAVDALSRQPYAVPELPDELYRVFLWDQPTKADWDALYIEGTNQEGKSKNFIQEQILAALDYQGSPLQLLLEGATGLVQPAQAAAPVAPSATPTQGAIVAPAAPAQAAAPVAGPVGVPAGPLAAPAAVPAPAAVVVPPSAGVTGAESASTPTSPINPGAPVLPVIPGQPA